jgi:putative chitinase
MMLKTEQLIYMFECSFDRASLFIDPLNSTLSLYDIDNLYRKVAFLAQIGHESGGLRYVKEIWNPTKCPWQAGYEGRKDLGNIQPGDGERFKGRGLIQITGRDNYNKCGKALKLPLLDQPELLERPMYASLSAGWFWKSHGLNELADEKNFEKITKIINGGLTKYADRLKLYHKILEILS